MSCPRVTSTNPLSAKTWHKKFRRARILSSGSAGSGWTTRRLRIRYAHMSRNRLRVSIDRGTFVYGFAGASDFKAHTHMVAKSNHQVLPFSVNPKYSNGCWRLLSSQVTRSSSLARFLRERTPGPARAHRCKTSHLRARAWHLTTRISVSRASFQISTDFARAWIPHNVCPLIADDVH